MKILDDAFYIWKNADIEVKVGILFSFLIIGSVIWMIPVMINIMEKSSNNINRRIEEEEKERKDFIKKCNDNPNLYECQLELVKAGKPKDVDLLTPAVIHGILAGRK